MGTSRSRRRKKTSKKLLKPTKFYPTKKKEENTNSKKDNNSLNHDISNYENISFSGINDSWVQIISSEGEMFYTGMLKKGHNLIVPNNEKLLITLGNAGAIGVEINKLGIMPIGQNGEIIQAVKLDYLFKKISYIDQANQ